MSRPLAESTAWLQSYEGKTTNAAVWDARFAGLIERVVADVRLAPLGVEQPLRDAVREVLGGPPDKLVIRDGQAILSACRSHSCSEKGLLWVDLATGAGAAAVLHYCSGANNCDPKIPRVLLTASEPGDVPPAFRREVDAWLAAKNVSAPSIVVQVLRDGSLRTL